jgi:prephenate dehydratase
MRDIQALTPVLSKELARLPERLPQGLHYAPAVPTEEGAAKVAFQGEPGAFSEAALLGYFPESVQSLPVQEFRDVFESVLTGKSSYGITPIENTLTGSIHQNYDLLLQYPDIRIVGEKTIRIIHNLIGLPGARLTDIKRVYSHPQGLSQCSRFLDGYPQWEKIPFYDTAGSIAFIAEQGIKENAGIASADAARVHKMEVLKEGIETDSRNYTRFVIIAREELAEAEHGSGKINRASLVFSTANTPGSLFGALQVLAERNINMVKLESRPIAGKPWEEMFYVDVDIPGEENTFQEALEELSKVTETLRTLGLYTV